MGTRLSSEWRRAHEVLMIHRLPQASELNQPRQAKISSATESQSLEETGVPSVGEPGGPCSPDGSRGRSRFSGLGMPICTSHEMALPEEGYIQESPVRHFLAGVEPCRGRKTQELRAPR